MARLDMLVLLLCASLCYSQTHSNDHQKITDLQTELNQLKSDFEEYRNETSAVIQQLKDRNSFLDSVQSTNTQTLSTLMTDVFKIRAKLGFITMDSVQQNSSLDIVLEAIHRLDKLNRSIEDVSDSLRNRSKCQRGNQYLRKCTSPNWDFAQCGNITVHVDFSPPFFTVPYVMLGVSKIDAGKDHNTRFQAYASSITRQGFDYTINTWGDSVLWGSTFEWLACPY
ncbi:uncharacterized protein LOC111104420 [Crassostrea virginica]|uniref:Uncharacterized protein LOC111104420 n=1 Tax=Crassostrea virginica TaxID=6565 RepID=A0A8B8ASL0_CRAVI|nr:uncharacterized protein LOC111104420 [Crassostrea virginica]